MMIRLQHELGISVVTFELNSEPGLAAHAESVAYVMATYEVRRGGLLIPRSPADDLLNGHPLTRSIGRIDDVNSMGELYRRARRSLTTHARLGSVAYEPDSAQTRGERASRGYLDDAHRED
jgi:hypothetical protein